VRTAYAGVPVATVPPQYGTKRGLVKEGFMGVVRGSKAQEAAEFYFNTLLSDEVQYQMSMKTGQIAVNRDVIKRLATIPVVKDLTVLDPAGIENMVRLDAAKINLSQWVEQWNRMIVR
jgi:ABC-type glycerol-3-phosphate transport system substrate-binding protein